METENEKLKGIAKELLEAGTWSDKIRVLDKAGFPNGEISRILTEMRGKLLRPQHVRNVLARPLKRPPKGDDQATGYGGPGRPQAPLSPAALAILEMTKPPQSPQPHPHPKEEQTCE